MTPGAVAMVRAHVAGRAAAQAGQPATVCPYRHDADTAQERAQARMWFRGYDRVNPFPVDFTS